MNQPHDVQIVLSHDRKYPFHASTLARSSVLFADMLTEPSAARLSTKAKYVGISRRWVVELVEMPTAQYPAGQLELIELNHNGERVDGFAGRVMNENGRIPTKIFKNWERVLYAFYGKDIRIADDDMGAALVDCIGLIEVSEYLGCVALIGKAVEVALLKHGQALFRSIQANPQGWANMSFRIRSDLIFRESIIHLAGHWNYWKKNRTAMSGLAKTPGAKQLAEKYHRRLVERTRALENKLASHYPGDIAVPKPNDIPIKREEYAKDILIWMALAWFRHWFTQRMIADKGHTADDGGYALYKAIGAGGDAYMDKAVISQFHGMFPITKKAINVIENHVCELKECMAEWVQKSNLMKSNCQLNVEKYPVGYMTCVEFENGDFFWLKDDRDDAMASKKGKRPGGNDIAQRNLEAAKRHQEQREISTGSEDLAVEDDEDDEEPVRAPKRGRFG
ncbi:phospholipid-translocating ATPase rsb1 [Didymosphaeria variabile]|uniref:Phospholipid-translocating ATPase rsb1 n=1 Tax=Didymosphaeria variabile TaxID=1932322 RepID=A0A9W8XR29_9PLEO|nr:phospholipid-translocating ATPase rsb1 [Didymosphaeria variabile]KAJ4356767.1 phospholipid-translocating ATPase rsb1 [Didymosphaeria variabile]